MNSTISYKKCWWGAHLPYLGFDSVGEWTTQVCDAWPMRRQTYGYLPSRMALRPATGTNSYCLVTEAHVCEQLSLTAERPVVELASSRVTSQRFNHYTTRWNCSRGVAYSSGLQLASNYPSPRMTTRLSCNERQGVVHKRGRSWWKTSDGRQSNYIVLTKRPTFGLL